MTRQPLLVLDKHDRIVVLPLWLLSLLGERELAITVASDACCVHVDVDGERLPPHQQRIESESLGASFWFDSQRRAIIG